MATVRECNAILAGGDRGLWSWLPVIVSAALPFLYLFDGVEGLPRYLSFSLLIFFIASMVSLKDLKVASERVRANIFSVVYIALPFSLLVLMAGAEDKGRLWILFVLVLVWSNDTFAFCTGKLIGRHKLSPKISPGKSIEGAVGGLVGGVIVTLVFNYYAGFGLEVWMSIMLAIVLGILSILGDLFESLIKRGSGVKDSGSLIPGHGGILDRVDSMVFVVPALYYFLVWYGVIV